MTKVITNINYKRILDIKQIKVAFKEKEVSLKRT